ncbi:MAG: hypothetical protein JNN15_19825 [Blastocatellia bacterium]|nr:hypothetical protein [Blastocatellia bacterium]
MAYSLFSVGSIKLLSPKNSSGLAAKDLTFSWKCSKPDTKLVLEVFDGEKLVMRQLVKGDSYTPDDDQKRDLKADKSYKWRVVADPDVTQKYSFKVESAIFYITKAMPPAVLVAPKPVETPSKPSKPLAEEEIPKTDSVKPPFYD